ncbi:MAG: hypothetical protein K2X66_15615 [Cyanobacteria bacterium]|nr:hypothetical protein [Cyanobacteriota bacterium]
MILSLRNNLVQTKPYIQPPNPKNNNTLQFGVCPICLTGGAIAGGGLLIGLITRLKKIVQSKKIAESPVLLPEGLKNQSDSPEYSAPKKASDVSNTLDLPPDKDACCL